MYQPNQKIQTSMMRPKNVVTRSKNGSNNQKRTFQQPKPKPQVLIVKRGEIDAHIGKKPILDEMSNQVPLLTQPPRPKTPEDEQARKQMIKMIQKTTNDTSLVEETIAIGGKKEQQTDKILMIPLDLQEQLTAKRSQVYKYLINIPNCNHHVHNYSGLTTTDLDRKNIHYIFENDYGISFPLISTYNLIYCRNCMSKDHLILTKSKPIGSLNFYVPQGICRDLRHVTLPSELNQTIPIQILGNDLWVNMHHDSIKEIDSTQLRDRIVCISKRKNFEKYFCLAPPYQKVTSNFPDFGTEIILAMSNSGYADTDLIIQPDDDEEVIIESDELSPDGFPEYISVKKSSLNINDKNKNNGEGSNNQNHIVEEDKIKQGAIPKNIKKCEKPQLYEAKIELYEIPQEHTCEVIEKKTENVIAVEKYQEPTLHTCEVIEHKFENARIHHIEDEITSIINSIPETFPFLNNSRAMSPLEEVEDSEIQVNHVNDENQLVTDLDSTSDESEEESDSESSDENHLTLNDLVLNMDDEQDYLNNVKIISSLLYPTNHIVTYDDSQLSINFSGDLSFEQKQYITQQFQISGFKHSNFIHTKLFLNGTFHYRWSITISKDDENEHFDNENDFNDCQNQLDIKIKELIDDKPFANLMPVVTILENEYLTQKCSTGCIDISVNPTDLNQTIGISQRNLNYLKEYIFPVEWNDFPHNNRSYIELLILLRYNSTIPINHIHFMDGVFVISNMQENIQ